MGAYRLRLLMRECVESAAQPQARLTATELGADRDFSVQNAGACALSHTRYSVSSHAPFLFVFFLQVQVLIAGVRCPGAGVG